MRQRWVYVVIAVSVLILGAAGLQQYITGEVARQVHEQRVAPAVRSQPVPAYYSPAPAAAAPPQSSAADSLLRHLAEQERDAERSRVQSQLREQESRLREIEDQQRRDRSRSPWGY